MANHIHITMPFIKSYCDAFNLDVDEALLSLLDILLTNSGDRTPIIGQVALGNRSRSQTLQICLHIVQKISNKKLLLKQLDEIYAKVINVTIITFSSISSGLTLASTFIISCAWKLCYFDTSYYCPLPATISFCY